MQTLPNEKQLSVLKRYVYEYIIICLTASNVYLFSLYNNLNTYITETISKQNERMIIVIEKNTAVIQNLKQ
jgi:hypothetical protein